MINCLSYHYTRAHTVYKMIFSGLRLGLFELVYTNNYGFSLPLVVIITAISNLVILCKNITVAVEMLHQSRVA